MIVKGSSMSDLKKMTHFAISPSLDGGAPEIVIELDSGFRCSFTATFEQIEDIADALEGILDVSTGIAEEVSDQAALLA